jgi:hypothetical protein
VGHRQSVPQVRVPQLPHPLTAPGTHSPGLWQTPDHWQLLPQASVPQLPTPHGRVDPGEQAPSPAQTPLQPQPTPPLLHVSVPHRPQLRVAPGMHVPSSPHALQAQVAEHVLRPQLPHAAESPALHSPSP